MSFRIHRDPAYRFRAGQFARIGLVTETGEALWRAYSIVSAPHEDALEFFLVVLPTGAFSSRVGRFNLGDTIRVEHEPQGFLTLDRFAHSGQGPRDLWLIATGTGLAPYLSILRDAEVWRQFERIVLVLSVRDRNDIAYEEELQAWAGAPAAAGRARFSMVLTLTRDQRHGALQGRIPALVESGALEAQAGATLDAARSRFMLCGNPDMVESMRALLKARGFRMNRRLEPGHIIVENYW
ncbi:MAG: ferredoxin--NADP reductase [Betaproteobacteria bacterium]|nr:ferredoxin--NADP reductase [Betaproteobacteria bacterium]